MDRPTPFESMPGALGSVPWRPLPTPRFDVALDVPPGTWVEAGFPDLHGRPVLQLREIALVALETPEIDREGRLAPEKRTYLDAYTERLAAGEEPPPVRVLETFAGTLKLTDGHRRWMAARRLGRATIKAWVSPVIAVPTSSGEVELLGMTAELAAAHLKAVPVTDTAAFRAWFGASKVVDGEGRPQVLYHGTEANFAAFDRQRAKANTNHPTARLGIFLTSNPEVAHGFIRARSGTQADDRAWSASHEAEARAARAAGFESVYRMPVGSPERKAAHAAGAAARRDANFRDGAKVLPVFAAIASPLQLTWEEWFKAADFIGETSDAGLAEIEARIAAGGHDGLLLPAQPGRAEEYRGDTWIVLRPEQIKSAIGNRGTFDPADPRITFSRRDAASVGVSTASEAFKGWFADSKVVDAEGQPLVVYHGTEEDFDAFDIGRAAKNFGAFGELSTRRAGAFFTPDKDFAKTFAGKTGNLMPTYLSIQNPLDLSEGYPSEFYTKHRALLSENNLLSMPVDGMWELFDQGFPGSEEFIAAVIQDGYDGVWMTERDSEGNARDVMVAFRPEQIKSAIGNVGAFGQRPITETEAQRAGMTTDEAAAAQAAGDIRFSRAAGGFYSPLLRSLDRGQGAPKRADRTAWQAWLDGAQRRGEFRKSEREWIGVDGWLSAHPGDITRDALIDFVRANEVRVREVLLEADASPVIEEIRDLFATRGYRISVFNEGNPDEEIVFEDPDGNEVESHELPRELAEAFAKALSAQQVEPRFTKYRAVAGGDAYRELLLTLPPAEKLSYSEWLREEFGRNAEDTQTARELYAAAPGRPAAEFRSNHWTQPNVLAHVRFDQRLDAGGQRILFIHELQSDWHQAGRKSGYGESPSRAVQLPDGAWTVEFSTGARMGEYPSREAAEAGSGRFPNRGVPDAPFKSTSEWVMLAIKHIVRWAALHEIDTVAWATGAQVAEMFDLSKQVDRIVVAKHGEGYDVVAYKDSEPVINRLGVDAARLGETIGKDLAERAIRETAGGLPTGFSGIDLKVGGEGLRGFYDQILPAAVNKWAKQFGGKVSGVDLRIPGAAEFTVTRAHIAGREEWRVWDTNDDVVGRFATETEARSQAQQRNASTGEGETTRVHAIDITPAMRAVVLAGLPLFARASASAGDDLWLADTRVIDADGRPRVVYRGEHGPVGIPFSSRLPSLTFSASAEVASTYAMTPNLRTDAGGQARVIPAVLQLRRPILETEDDPFFDFAQVERTLGREVAERFAVRYSERVMVTDYWQESFSHVESVEALLAERPDTLRELFVDAYLLLDDPEFVAIARAAGYDGAIHLGNGASALEIEYRVFDAAQARPLADVPWSVLTTSPQRPATNDRGTRDLIHAHAEGVRRRAEALTAGWPIDVRVVDSPWHLPAAVRAHSGFDASRVDAVQAHGQVFIVASRVRSDAQLQTLLAHEAVGHVGVETILGPERFERVLRQIDRAREAGHHAELFAEVARRYEGFDRRTQACEAIAVFAERRVATPWLIEVIAAVRAFLRDTLKLPLAFREVDLEGLVARAARWVQTPARDAGLATPSADAAYARGEAQPLWRSALTEAVERGQGAPKRAAGAVWQAWFDGAQRRGEFRKSERDWVGVDAWLEGRVEVSREAVAEFVRANGVALTETLLTAQQPQLCWGSWSDPEDDPAGDAFIESSDGRWRLVRDAQGWFDVYERLPDGHWDVLDGFGALDGEVRARAVVEELAASGQAERAPRFPQHVLAGGENYRELLIQLPSEPVPATLQWEQTTDDMLTADLPSGRLAVIVYDSEALENGATLNTTDQDGECGTQELQFDSVEKAKAAAPSLVVARHEDRPGYRSDHWQHPNVLVHVRFDERTGADGKRAVLIGEFQSDWHQRGRKTGYAGDVLSADQEARHDALVARHAHLTVRESAELLEIACKRNNAARGVPQAPFRQTDAWAMLAFRRAVRFAVDHGFDQIAWISGAAAASLMQVAQHVDQLWYLHRFDGRLDLGGSKDGQYRSIAQAVAPTELDRFVGKELASRILEGAGLEACPFPNGGTPMRVIEGEDLRIGGDGIKAFYDQILPAAVKRWARPFGATLTRVQLDNTEGEHWAVDITPAMRAAVAMGQPMFYRGPKSADALTTWFGDSKVANANGTPKVVYHGTGGDVEAFRRMPWASESPELANEYAAMRGECYAGAPNVLPLVMRIERPFDADADLPSAVTVNSVIAAVVQQAQAAGRLDSTAALQSIEDRRGILAKARIREESGPYYNKHDFWLETRDFFGADGSQALREIFEIAGFDGITLREQGARTWGAFTPEQVKSATGNSGGFDPSDSRIAFARSAHRQQDPAASEETPAPVRAAVGFGL